MHWRPLATIGAITALVCAGIVLRYLAPDRFLTSKALSSPAAVAPACPKPCWSSEACQLGQCVWQRPNDVTRVAHDARISGPFTLPKDVSDALPLDPERFAVALLTGAQIHNARTGEVLSLVTDAPQARRLYRVGDVIYATAPQRIYVIGHEGGISLGLMFGVSGVGTALGPILARYFTGDESRPMRRSETTSGIPP